MIAGAVSVIIPSYNRCQLLKRALASVLAQSLPAFEIIVVDDGSTDDTAVMMATCFPLVIYHYQANQGVSAARNQGIRLAKGEWLAFLDADDVWHANKLAEQITALAAAPDYLICHSNENWLRHDLPVKVPKKYHKQGGWLFEQCLALCAVSPSTVMIHRQLFAEIGLFDESLPACEDYDLWLRISARYPLLLVQEALITKYGGHADQLSQCVPGLDRYRVQALVKIVNSQWLNVTYRLAAVNMLLNKANILLQGARKRALAAEIVYYQDLINSYQDV